MQSIVTDQENQSLTQIPSSQEIELAIRFMNCLKSPSPYGMATLLY